MYSQTYKYKNVKTNIVCDHSQLPTSCIPLDEHFDFFNTCQFLHWNYFPQTQHLGPLSIFVLFFQSISLLVSLW